MLILEKFKKSQIKNLIFYLKNGKRREKRTESKQKDGNNKDKNINQWNWKEKSKRKFIKQVSVFEKINTR